MAKQSEKVMSLLTEFMVREIGSKALDGITYTMTLKDPKDKENTDRYKEIYKEVRAAGFSSDEVFRAYEVSNGYIFDMDLNVVKNISIQLAKAVERTNGIKFANGDLIGDSPEKRRKSDMNGLANYVLNEFKKGNTITEVALFSRNSVPHIVISGKTLSKNGKPENNYVTVKYNAYAIRHWDIEVINSKLLIPAGIRISKIEPCEVLPSKTGVKFLIYTEAC